jgi:predicted glycogen debranching enzyme
MINFKVDSQEKLSLIVGHEWLVTNGIGGYASGTVSGMLTRRYHGYLIAALKPPVRRTLLVSKLDETAAYEGQEYALFANRWAGDIVEPDGHLNIRQFLLDGTTPVWMYGFGDALLEKSVWMQNGANTTYVRYNLQRANAPLTLAVKVMVNYRDHHSETRAGVHPMLVNPVNQGFQVDAYHGAVPFYLLSDDANVQPQHEWYRDYFLAVESFRGLEAIDDNLYAGFFNVDMKPDESVTFVFSTQESVNLDGEAAYLEHKEYERDLIEKAGLPANPSNHQDRCISQLVLAADQFIVTRQSPDQPEAHINKSNGRTIIAGYHWFTDWGRDTMISLPGLTLATGRPDIASKILRLFSQHIDQGRLPNRFPDAGEVPEYNTVDATLWYFEAIRAYHAATGDDELLRELFPLLESIISWHRKGTRYKIHVDPADGLLYAGEPGANLTWMDAKVGTWVVTPRIGKPVEVNALWYNALCTMVDFAKRLGVDSSEYTGYADSVKSGFNRFWNHELGYCFDVIDTPHGDDPSLRPNFASEPIICRLPPSQSSSG